MCCLQHLHLAVCLSGSSEIRLWNARVNYRPRVGEGGGTFLALGVDVGLSGGLESDDDAVILFIYCPTRLLQGSGRWDRSWFLSPVSDVDVREQTSSSCGTLAATSMLLKKRWWSPQNMLSTFFAHARSSPFFSLA